VVISIIGLLAALILTNIAGTRDRARDTTIKKQFHTLRTKIAYDFSNTGSYQMVCEETCGGSDNSILTQSGDYKRINDLIKKNNKNNSDVVCNESSDCQSYAAWTQLNNGKWYCISSDVSTPFLSDSPPSDNSTDCQ